MVGLVIKWNQTDYSAAGRIETRDRQWWSVRGENVKADCIGRVFLEVGECVFFDAGPTIDRKDFKRAMYTAINVRRLDAETKIDPMTHREVCRVKNKDFLIREKGGLLTTNMTSDCRISELLPGQIVECGVMEVPSFKTWTAVNIKILPQSKEHFSPTKISQATV